MALFTFYHHAPSLVPSCRECYTIITTTTYLTSHLTKYLPAGFHLCRSCGHASDSPDFECARSAWISLVPTACLVLSVLAPPDAVCLQQQQQLPAISHHDPSSLYELSLSFSLSISFSDLLSRPPRFSSTSHHSVRRVLLYTAPHRTAPHRTHYYHSTPHYHPSLTTHHSPPTKLVLPPTWTFHSYTPAIHPSIHCCTTPTLNPLPRNRVVFVEASLQHTSGSTACIGTRHTRTKSTTDEMTSVDIDFTRRNKKPRLLTDSERDKLDEFIDAIHYSSR